MDALETVQPDSGPSVEQAMLMLSKLSQKQQKDVLVSLVQNYAPARAEVKHKHESMAAQNVDLAAVQQQINSAAQSARPRQAFLKIVAAAEHFPAVSAFEALAPVANVLTYDLPPGNNRFLWQTDFLSQYADGLRKAAQRMSDAELQPLAIKYEDDFIVTAANVGKKNAFDAYLKEVSKRVRGV